MEWTAPLVASEVDAHPDLLSIPTFVLFVQKDELQMSRAEVRKEDRLEAQKEFERWLSDQTVHASEGNAGAKQRPACERSSYATPQPKTLLPPRGVPRGVATSQDASCCECDPRTERGHRVRSCKSGKEM